MDHCLFPKLPQHSNGGQLQHPLHPTQVQESNLLNWALHWLKGRLDPQVYHPDGTSSCQGLVATGSCHHSVKLLSQPGTHQWQPCIQV